MSAPRAIDVEASLDVELGGQALTVHASQGVIVINLETPGTARALFREIRGFGSLRLTVARLNAVFLSLSQRLELHVDGVLVAAMGLGTKSGFLRLAGLPHVRIWPWRLARRSVSL